MERREAIDEASTPAQLAKLQHENDQAVAATISNLSDAFRSNDLPSAIVHTERLIYLYSALEELSRKRHAI